MTTNVNLDLWHNAGYVLGILTEAMPVGFVSLRRDGAFFEFAFSCEIRKFRYSIQLTMHSNEIADRNECQRVAQETAGLWNSKIRSFHDNA